MASTNRILSDGASCKAACSWSITVQQLDSWAYCSAVRAAGGVRCRSCDMIELLSSAFSLRATLRPVLCAVRASYWQRPAADSFPEVLLPLSSPGL
jgi:hypothetical protein